MREIAMLEWLHSRAEWNAWLRLQAAHPQEFFRYYGEEWIEAEEGLRRCASDVTS